METTANLVHATPGAFLIVVCGYLVLLGFIGYYATLQTKSLREYFVMSGKAGTIISGLAYFSTQYSMSTFMGVPGTTYKVGFAGLSVSVPGLAFSMLIPALLVGRKLIRLGHRHKMLTMADYLSDRFESTAIRGLLALMMVVFLVPMMGAQTIGAGIIFHTYTGAPEWVGIVIMGVTVILYCMCGGMRGAMLTDVIQGTLMVLTAVVTFTVSVKLGGGLEAITSKLAATNPSYLSHPGVGNAMPWQNYVSMIIMWSFFTIGQPHLFTKFFAMKNYKVMFQAVLLGTAGMWFSATLIEWSGVNGIVSIPGLKGVNTDFIVPLLLQNGVNPYISALMIAGIFAAGMSTISGVLITSTGAITRDMYQKILKRDATDDDVFRLSRIVTVVLGVLAIIIGIYHPASIFTLVLFAFGGLGIWVTPVLLGMYWKRATKAGAFVSIITGVILYVAIVMKFKAWSFGFNPLIVAWAATMLIMVAVSLATTPASQSTIKRHFDDLETSNSSTAVNSSVSANG